MLATNEMCVSNYFYYKTSTKMLVPNEGSKIKLSLFLYLASNLTDDDLSNYSHQSKRCDITFLIWPCLISVNKDKIIFSPDIKNIRDVVVIPRLTLTDLKAYEEFVSKNENKDWLKLEGIFTREDGIDINNAMYQIEKKFEKLVKQFITSLTHDSEGEPSISHNFEFGDKSGSHEIIFKREDLVENINSQLQSLYDTTEENINQMKIKLINYKLDLGKYIVVFNNNINIEYNVKMSLGYQLLTYTYISGYIFRFGFDIYTAKDFYEYGARGYFELKLNNLNPNNTNYNNQELLEWASSLSIDTSNINKTYQDLQKWVYEITWKKQ